MTPRLKEQYDKIIINDLQKESNELAGSGGAPVIIQDNSQNQSNSSAPLVLPAADISPGNGQSVLQK